MLHELGDVIPQAEIPLIKYNINTILYELRGKFTNPHFVLWGIMGIGDEYPWINFVSHIINLIYARNDLYMSARKKDRAYVKY